MDNLISEKFEEANRKLEEGDLVAFVECLVDLYSKLTCNCFFRDQNEIIFKKQLELIEKHENEEGFYINLAKGFIYLRLDEDKLSFDYLSKAIDFDNFCDLPYSLRASIDKKINPLMEKDAMNAVLYNPTARNYFVLANVYDYKDDETAFEKSIFYLGKAIELRPDFSCAYNNRAIRLSAVNDFQGAINDYLRCIEIEKTHWAYYQLWNCLDEAERYDEALQYIKLGSKIHPNKIEYQFGLGFANERLGKYKTAIKHYKKYLKVNTDDKNAEINLMSCIKKLKEKSLSKAQEYFLEKNFEKANLYFEKYFDAETELYDDDTINSYYISMLKNNNSEISIDENNPIYKILDGLRVLYEEKDEAGEELHVEEENIKKLMVYQSHYRIGFGTYEGKLLSEIIEENPEYVLWCIINLEHFSIDKSLFLKAKLKNEPTYLLALEHNFIKELVLAKWNPYNGGADFDYYDDNQDHNRDTFEALTDGHLGDWEDFEGNIDDVKTWLGR